MWYNSLLRPTLKYLLFHIGSQFLAFKSFIKRYQKTASVCVYPSKYYSMTSMITANFVFSLKEP